MKYDELNIVRTLKKKAELEAQKLSALKESIRPTASKIAPDKVSHGTNTSTPTETLATLITDAERKLARLNCRIEDETLKLTRKIQAAVPNETEQILLIHRYINCKRFREIGLAMGFSEAHVYFTHRKILKNLIVDDSQ